ncbi:amino acid adenylation domain-containing protein [Schlegelella sp. S2-27]|uniref:Amino acid adenylation domain-containing protein n=1 Tax=Caldimonas mangrovi TaxID=2944811 RepID=A0ABT0YS32_9BURK|nr:non-ribosomal peptide synthetase [Caldimonas mangrovi]MCM5681092.1 amino acid adenylation domain-containing protein [Caldimonas mangrovi]
MDISVAEKIARRFATLPAEQRRAVYEKMREQGLSMAQLPILPIEGCRDAVPLSAAQQRQWFLWQLDRGSTAYHLCGGLVLEGEVDVGALEASFHGVVRRHESLRTVFRATGDGLAEQVMRPDAQLQVARHDLSGLAGGQREARALELARELSEQPFDLEGGPLLRVALLQLQPQEHRLVVVMHHIVSDGWSMQLFVDEFAACYRALCRGEPVRLAELPIQYADYAVWQRQWLQAGERERQLGYWRGQLGQEHPVLALPSDQPRHPQGRYRGARHRVSLPQPLCEQLRRSARGEGVTVFMLLLSGLHALLHRYTGQRDIRIGVPIANRQRVETEGVIGFFVNTQVLRAQLQPRQSLGQLLEQVREAALGAQAHQDLPFEQLVEALQPERSLGHHPLFQVMFNHVRQDRRALEQLPGLQIRDWELGEQAAQFELSVDTLEQADGRIEATFHYAAELFEPATIERLAQHYLRLVQQLCERPQQAIGDVVLLDAPEQALLQQWGQGGPAPAPAQPVHRLIEQQVQRTPGAMAVVYGDEQLSYAELNRRANRLAHRLIGLGVGPEVRVGLALERSVEMVVALLAVLKAGGAYVPLDPQYPAERLQWMVHDSGVALLLTQAGLRGQLQLPPQLRVLEIDREPLHEQPRQDLQNPNPLLHGEHLAYVIYTSGSTGRPKGAANRHSALYNRLAWMQRAYALGADDTVLQKTPYGFDVSVWEFFWPLMVGATLAVAAPGDHREPARLVELIRRHRVTTLHFVPSMLQAFVAHEGTDRCTSLRRIVCSGEALPAELQVQALKLWPQAGLYNLYGPTEAAIDVTHWTCRDEGRPSVPIGRPIDGVSVSVLDEALNPVAPGVAGELYLGGAGLGRGYLGRAALTAERFVATAGGERLYRTGDLVRWRSDGQLDYLGRLDHQVKIRGQRIELGEIEAQLQAQPTIREAVVAAQPGRSGVRLVAYVTTLDGAGIDTQAVRDALAAHLPDYMVPSVVMTLDAFPLNANGKLDRKALPVAQFAAAQDHEPPQGAVEQALAAVWAEVLELQQVGRHDNFFELGGDSILSLQIVARASRAGWRLSPRQLFERQTLAELARVAEAADPAPAAAPSHVPSGHLADHLSADALAALPFGEADVEDVFPLSPTQEGMLFHTLESPGSGLYVNQLSVEVSGVDVGRLVSAWRSMVQRHAALRTGFLWQAGMPRPLQYVLRRAQDGVTVLDWRGVSDPAERIARYVEDDHRRGFDLLAPPLARLAMIRLDDDRWHMVWTQHHILLDGWSDSRLVGDWLRCYGGESLDAPGPGYGDYIRWLARQDVHATQAFWRRELASLDGPTLLAETAPKVPGRTGFGKLYTRLGVDETRALQAHAQRERITLNTLVQGAWALVLQRYTGKEQVVFGATVAGRPASLPRAEEILGLFINTLPVPVKRQAASSVAQFLRELQSTNLRLREQEHSALADVQRWAGSSGRPLFDSIIVFENYPVDRALRSNERHGLRFGDMATQGLTGYAMDLQVTVGERLEIEYCYALQDFADDFVHALRGHVEHLLRQMVDFPQRAVGELQWLTPPERQALFTLGRNESVAEPYRLPVHRQIARHAAERPEAIALLMGEQELSYGDLDRRANRLAHALRARGIGPEARVGVAMERSLDVIIALLSVLKAGAAYVPLDPEYPADRLAYMMADSGLSLLLTQARVLPRLQLPAGMQALTVDEADLQGLPDHEPNVALGEHALAYVIYTSGSTGRPKGVAVTHGPLAMHCRATAEIYGMTPQSCELLFMSLSFDGAHERWLTALTVGAGLALRDNELWTAEQTFDALHRYGVTNAAFPPAYLGQVAEWAVPRDNPPPVELYVFGGEAMPKASYDKVRQALRPRLLINGYGPTETVVTPLIWKTEASRSFDCAYAPIGRPVGERTAYVLDADLQPVPRGVAGELYIGGYGLARGYLGQAGLTAQRFVADPFDERGGRLYRTGDLVRWLDDGNVEYLGRVDHQVKIRGFRIELGEIEARIREHGGVADVAVIAQDAAAGRQLVAYVVPAVPAARLAASVKQALGERLPDYMVPAHVVAMERLPRLPSGKLDRNALPAPVAERQRQHVPPSTAAARTLARVWQEVLGVESIGETDNFFELGGDSLSSLKVIAKMRQCGDPALNFKLRDLLQRPTIAALLGLEATQARQAPLLLNPHRPQAPSLFCLHAGVGTIFDYQPLARRLDGACNVYGLPCRSLADPAWRDVSIEQMAIDYAGMVRAVQPHGPYRLLGWSLGGTLAAAIAALLEAAGEEVDFLGLIDPYVPGLASGPAGDDWRDDFHEFIAEVLPGAGVAGLPACAEPGADELVPVLQELLGRRDDGHTDRYAGMGADDLARLFVVARHLKALSRNAAALRPVRCPSRCWWIEGRASSERLALEEQLAQPAVQAAELDVTHFGIVRHADVQEDIARALAGEVVGSGAGSEVC